MYSSEHKTSFAPATFKLTHNRPVRHLSDYSFFMDHLSNGSTFTYQLLRRYFKNVSMGFKSYTKIFSFLALMLFGIQGNLFAQDARFSQINASPLQLNPAMTGIYKGQFRFVANYRELYSSVLKNTPYRTIASSFDVRVPVQRRDYAGFGLTILRDEVGLANFNRFTADMGGSFMKKLSTNGIGDQYLIAGGQVGIGQRGFDFDNLWFSRQYDQEVFEVNTQTPSGETLLEDSDYTGIYFNLNAGVLWYTVIDDNLSIYAGGAVHHINTPNISFLGNPDEKLDRRFVGHAGGEIPVSKEISMLPAIAFFRQGKAMSTTFGGNFRYTSREWNEVALRVGGWFHVSNKLENSFFNDAFIVTAVLETEKFNFGLSYDITTSSLVEANNARGAFELSLTYIHPEKRRNKLECPKY